MNNYNQLHVPTFTLQDYKISVNTACIKNFPEFNYVQIMINPNEKKLALRPCKEDTKNALRWCSATVKRSPRKITCRIFCAKIMSLMDWNPINRYRIFGDFIGSEKEPVFVFNLNTPEIYGQKTEHHSLSIQADTINGYTVFHLQRNPMKEVIT